MTAMGKSFLQGLITFFAGSAVAIIIIAIVFKIGWESKEDVLVWGYGSLSAVVGFYFILSRQLNKTERDMIKSNKVKIDQIEAKFTDLKETLEYVLRNQEESHATIDNIYHLMVHGNNKGNRR